MSEARWTVPGSSYARGESFPGKVNGLEAQRLRRSRGTMTPPPRKRGDPFIIVGLATYVAAFLTPSFFSLDVLGASVLAVTGTLLVLVGLRRVWRSADSDY